MMHQFTHRGIEQQEDDDATGCACAIIMMMY